MGEYVNYVYYIYASVFFEAAITVLLVLYIHLKITPRKEETKEVTGVKNS
jgi:uncharacterized membrane protein